MIEKTGILMLIDVVDYTAQSVKRGTRTTQNFTKHFEKAMRSLAKTYNAYFIRIIGDAVLLFFESTIGFREQFLDFTTQLHIDSSRGVLDKFNFKCKLRTISHFGTFHFESSVKRLKDFIGPQGIQIFRIEKLAGDQGVFLADSVLNLLESTLNERNIEVEEKFDGNIDGFRHKIRIYQLVFPVTNEEEPDLLDLKMEELEKNCREIPVFGTLYPPMRMEDSFINLDISPASNLPLLGRLQPDGEYPSQKTGRSIDSIIVRERSKDFNDSLSIEKIYNKFPRAIFLGLPGCGKTTTLKYFAFKEFQSKKHIKNSEDERLVIFVSCHRIARYAEWFDKHQDLYRGKTHLSGDSVESFLYYFLHEFLFQQSLPVSRDTAQKAGRSVWAAFSNGRLTLLVDALDEARSSDTKEGILNALRKLFHDCRAGKKAKNRLYITARFSESDQVLSKKWEEIQEPIFWIRSLDMEQLRRMAEYFYKNDKFLYNHFSEAAWKDEIATKVGGTPLTALLVLIYFQCFHTLDNRFEMYNIMMTFLLARAWKHIKEGTFSWDIKTFFNEVKNGNIFAEEPYKDAGGIYDALSMLAYACEKEQIEDVNELELLALFKKFAADVVGVVGERTSLVEEEAKKWLSRLKEDHVLLPFGAANYVFIHQTVMEYLAARFIKEKLKDHRFHQDKFHSDTVESVINTAGEPFFQTEILPIAVGSEIEIGAKLLRLLNHRVSIEQEEKMKEVLYLMAIKCLAEWECHFDRRYRELKLSMSLSDLKRQESDNNDAVEWIYTYIKDIIESKDRQVLKTFRDKHLRAIPRLTRSILMTQFLSANNFFTGDSELIALRKELLEIFVAGPEVDRWFKQYEQEMWAIVDGNLFDYDSKSYHPDDKNFNYYHRYTGSTLQGLLGSPNFKHSHCVTCVAISPDGKTVLSGSEDKTIKWWDMETGKEIKTFRGHDDYIKSVVFSPDGQTMVSGSDDKTIKSWDLESGREICTLKGHEGIINCIVFSPEGNTIISGSSDNTIKCWDLQTAGENFTLKGHENAVNSLAVSLDGRIIISGSDDKTVKWWDLETGQLIRTFTGHADYVKDVAFGLNGKTIISASWDSTIKTWDMETGKEIRTIKGHDGPINSIAVSTDGRYLVSTSWDKTIKCWELESGNKTWTFIGHCDHVRGVALSSDGKTMVSGARDSTVRCWNLGSGKEIRTFRGHENFVNSIYYSPNGETLIAGSRDGTLKWWDLQSGKEIKTFKGHHDHINSVCFSPDGKTVISGAFDKTLKWWDLETARLIKTFNGHDYGLSCVCFHPAGRTVVSGSFDNTLKLWDLESGKAMRTFRGHEGYVWSVAISPDGKTMASGSDDKTIRCWDKESGKVIKTFPGHEGYVYSVYFSPDGKTLVSGSSDQTLNLWDLESGKVIRMFRGHEGIVWSAVFSVNGKYLISCSWDNTIKIWEQDTGKCIETIDLLWRPREIRPNPAKEGFYACANVNGTIALFDFSRIMNRKED